MNAILKEARRHTPLSPETLASLLVRRRVITEPAPRELLQARLDERLREKEWRNRHGGGGWPRSVSDNWLQQEIDHLQRALEATP